MLHKYLHPKHEKMEIVRRIEVKKDIDIKDKIKNVKEI